MSIVCSNSNLNNIDKSTPTNYQLVFPKIPTESNIGANNPFVMNIHSAIIPSVSIAVEEYRWQGTKANVGLIPMEFDPWLVSFTVDSNLANWNLLRKWMQFINNNNDKIAEYHTEYAIDAAMVITDNYGNMVKEILFIDIWPMQIGEISFSQREGDVLLESTVNFNYDYFKVRSTAWTEEFSSSSQSSSSRSWASSSSSSSSTSSSSSESSSSSSQSISSSSRSSSSSDFFVGAFTGYNPDPLINGNVAEVPLMIDGNIYAKIDGDTDVDYQTSFWVGTETAQTICGITAWMKASATTYSYDAWAADIRNCYVGAYKSDDGINWTKIGVYIKPPVVSPSDQNNSGFEFAFRVYFNTPQTARWFKIRNDWSPEYGTGNYLWGVRNSVLGGSAILTMCEMEYYYDSCSSSSSSSSVSSS